jgi:hypothetical protein
MVCRVVEEVPTSPIQCHPECNEGSAVTFESVNQKADSSSLRFSERQRAITTRRDLLNWRMAQPTPSIGNPT